MSDDDQEANHKTREFDEQWAQYRRWSQITFPSTSPQQQPLRQQHAYAHPRWAPPPGSLIMVPDEEKGDGKCLWPAKVFCYHSNLVASTLPFQRDSLLIRHFDSPDDITLSSYGWEWIHQNDTWKPWPGDKSSLRVGTEEAMSAAWVEANQYLEKGVGRLLNPKTGSPKRNHSLLISILLRLPSGVKAALAAHPSLVNEELDLDEVSGWKQGTRPIHACVDRGSDYDATLNDKGGPSVVDLLFAEPTIDLGAKDG